MSRDQMEQVAHARYEQFDERRREAERMQADAEDLQEIERIEQEVKQLKGRS